MLKAPPAPLVALAVGRGMTIRDRTGVSGSSVFFGAVSSRAELSAPLLELSSLADFK